MATGDGGRSLPHAAREAHVFLVRHARTALNAGGQLRGHLDPPLDDLGATEARGLADTLGYLRPTRIVASPLRRAVQTAEPLARRCRLQVEVDAGLIDRDYGEWAGWREEDLVDRWGSVAAAPGVEAAAAVVHRAMSVLDAQRGVIGDGPVVLVSHDAVNKQLLAALEPSLGAPDAIEQHTACWNLLARVDDGWRVLGVDQRP